MGCLFLINYFEEDNQKEILPEESTQSEEKEYPHLEQSELLNYLDSMILKYLNGLQLIAMVLIHIMIPMLEESSLLERKQSGMMENLSMQ